MSTIFEFSTIKQIGAVLIAVVIVLAAGTVVGQAPALFGADVTTDPEASIEFPDQSGDGTSVTVDTVSLSDGGFVVVTNGGDVVGVSDYLESGTHENVTVEQRDDEDLEMLGQLTATALQDTTDTGTFVSEADAAEDEDLDEHDRPYSDGGYPVSDTATVTMSERPDEGESSTSFVVESVDAPESVTANGSVDITTEIRNPNEFDDRQHVDFRLDGQLVERQVLSLDADETRELNVTISLDDVEPGDHIYGIYTTDDGALGELTVEPDDAGVTVLEAESDRVVADATLTTDGFLAVEAAGNDTDTDADTDADADADNETDTDTENSTDTNTNPQILGTSDSLEAGDHENVTIALEEPLEDGETISVVVYEGSVDDVENASAYSVGDERIEETVVVGEDLGGDGTGDSESDDETEADEESDGTESEDTDETGDDGAETSDE
ncbi:DUF7282 domain-containing protein [Natronoglomus mannanivorans]|uniref:DUF4179 domain-containing protein n=1 Tax=Natronoglomus mannanivorans TaxID=2979990 RepID=A0AAP3E3H3_9EURY|nr:DUF4179 domain-containing protein [Halobacteria archaeon AArc-xg1-1]